MPDTTIAVLMSADRRIAGAACIQGKTRLAGKSPRHSCCQGQEGALADKGKLLGVQVQECGLATSCQLPHEEEQPGTLAGAGHPRDQHANLCCSLRIVCAHAAIDVCESEGGE